MSQPTVSIVIPTYGRDDLLRNLIESIRSSTPQSVYELIVVSSDPTESLKVQFLKEQFDVKLVLAGQRSERQLRKASLQHFTNLGIRVATKEWVLFVNDDMSFDKLWYQKFCEKLLSLGNSSIGMIIVAADIGSTSLGPRTAVVGQVKVQGCWEDLWLSDFSLIRREIVEEFGLFDENLQWYGHGIDNTLNVRLKTKSLIVVADDIVIRHHISKVNRRELTESPYFDFGYLRKKWDRWCAENGYEYRIDFGYNFNSLFQALKFRLIRLVGRVRFFIERK